jgi:1,4-dihydroxy-2-naphthoate polyprenyltransferase
MDNEKVLVPPLAGQDNLPVIERLQSWIRITRLQFYPMAFIAYSMGAAAAFAGGTEFNVTVFTLGYVLLFLIEFCTVLTNEYYDYTSDYINANFSMFSGGTRVLVEGRLGSRDVRAAVLVTLFLIIILSFILLRIDRSVPPLPGALMLAAGLFFGLGYTMPPLKFSYRGLGELVVGGTHSIYLVLCGYVFQTGAWNQGVPYLLSIPLFLAVLGAIILAGLPDRPADCVTSKRTIAVMLGPVTATVISGGSIAAAALSAIFIFHETLARTTWAIGSIVIALHAAVLLWALAGLMRSKSYDMRIDKVLSLALSYIIWFGVFPLVSFL